MTPAPPTMSPDWDGAADSGPNGVEVRTFNRLSRDGPLPYRFTLNSGSLVDCDDVTEPGTFPQYGTFLDVVHDDDAEYLEAPASLLSWLDKANAEPGDTVTLVDCHKTADGLWAVDLRSDDV